MEKEKENEIFIIYLLDNWLFDLVKLIIKINYFIICECFI